MKFLILSIISMLSVTVAAGLATANDEAPACNDYSGVWVGSCNGPTHSYRASYLLKQNGCESLDFYNRKMDKERTIKFGKTYRSRFTNANNNFFDLRDKLKWNRNQSRLSYTRYGTMDNGFEFYDVDAYGEFILSRDGRRLTEYSDWEYQNRFGRRYFERYRCNFRYRGEVDDLEDASTLPKSHLGAF